MLKRKVQRTWHLRKLETWASSVSVVKLAEDILRIRGEMGLNDTFSTITVDLWGNSEVMRDLSKLTRGSGLEWRATPIVESEGSSRVRAAQLMRYGVLICCIAGNQACNKKSSW
jgi:hypothetical protein